VLHLFHPLGFVKPDRLTKGTGPVMAKAKVEIDRDRCKGCGLCTITCPKKSLRLGAEINPFGYFYACWEDSDACTGCAVCGEICPDVAIRVWRDRGRSKT
jgi:2-oxoglutarate ferredoxin oxidoreductase subunit delta